MSRRFISANRAQPFLFPPCIDDWVEEDHFARFLVDCVDHFDLRGFTHAYSPEGGAPYEPKMMLTVLLYAWCQGIRSSRKIAAACRNRIDFRWLTGNLRPDHCAFARFFQRHGEEIRELFTRVLYLCGQAGAVRLGVVSLDGTKVCGSASLSANRTLSRLREEIRRMEDEMRRADAADNARFGSRGSGEELPEELRDHRQRLARLRQAYERLELDLAAERALASSPSKKGSESGGQAPWSVPAQGELPFGPAQDTAVVQPSSCGGVEASGASPAASSGERGGEEPPVSVEEPAAGESRCCAGERETSEQTARSEQPQQPQQPEKTGKGRGSKKKAKKKEARVNVTDADSRIMKGRQGLVQGYNGQAVVNEDQFVVACGVTQDENDLHQLEPMLLELERSLAAAGIEGRAKWLNADAGYWRQDVEVDKLEQAGPKLLIATCNPKNQPKEAPRGRIPKSATTTERMRRKLSTRAGRATYKKRGITVEPVFGQIKECLNGRRFLRRGLEKAEQEWRLLCGCLNLRKLFVWLGKKGQSLCGALAAAPC